MPMTSRTTFKLLTLVALLAGGVLVSAQQPLLPSVPPKQFGGSVTPAFEGWYDNADGTHSFLIGYFSRNTDAEIDVPIGPANHFEPGNPDMGQPTHFLAGRRYGMFVYTMPKEFGKQQKLKWVLTVNGVTTTVPFYMSPDYNLSPFTSSEESAGGGYNVPPVLRFASSGPSFVGPAATIGAAMTRTTSVAAPLTLDLWADDDAKYSSGASSPMRNAPPPVNLTWSKYRGPGAVTFAQSRPKLEATKGGQPNEAYSGKAATTATFSAPGEYVLHVTANDYSGSGGGGSGCCWTNAMVKVTVSGGTATTTGDQ
jgi:hypothetical protein